jgi:phospholipid-binding lipoprotein MlaA
MNKYKMVALAFLILFLCSVAWAYAGPATESDQTEPTGIANDQKSDDFELDDEFEDESGTHVFDPLIGYNRFMTRVNDKLYFWLLKPVARGLSIVIPEPGRLAINRFFKNIFFPIRLVNNLLQMKIKHVGIETARFGVNTTIGVLGLGDPAKSWLGLDAYEEDFGQTLGHYGVGSGFYIVLPIFGPSNVRDTIGMVPDYFLNPINYLDSFKYRAGTHAVDTINYTSLHIGEYEDLKKGAVDFYIFMRDSYEQNRDMKIAE